MKPKKQKINVIKANPSTVSPNEQLATRNVSVNLLANILLIAYGYVTVMTPNWMAFDSNAPKFLTFAILNLITAGFVLFVKDFRANNNILFSFFLNKIGITYCIIILLSVASFAKVINVEEAMLHFFKF